MANSDWDFSFLMERDRARLADCISKRPKVRVYRILVIDDITKQSLCVVRTPGKVCATFQWIWTDQVEVS